jgi:hypothetical protein
MFASLNPRDRRLLLACLVIVALAAGVVAILAPQEDDANVVPSSFSSGTHGAEAAYLTLERSGYRVERSERPLSELAQQSDAQTVVILADPMPTRKTLTAARSSVAAILQHGGRVIATGSSGGDLLPQGQVAELPQIPGAAQSDCTAEPDGFGELANSGAVHFREADLWRKTLPEQSVEYTCGRDAVVVSYAVGPGHAIWWADSLPLENAFIAKDGDLTLLLNSLGGAGNRIVWDESLHNDEPGIWSYANGTPVRLLWLQLALATMLLVVSFSRRSGPLLPDPVVARDAPLEFVYSLGALYDRAGATNTAVQIAYARFCLMLGLKRKRSSADEAKEMMAVASSRLGRNEPELQPAIEMCEETTYAPAQMPPRQALELVQSLNKFEREVRQGTLGRNKEQ